MRTLDLIKRRRPAPVPGTLLLSLAACLVLAACLAMAASPPAVRAADSLATWRPMASGTAARLLALWGTSSSDLFAVGSGGTILHYDGAAWTGMASGTTKTLNGVWGTSADNVYAVGTGGSILHYDGTSWTAMTSGTAETLNGVWGATSSDVFAVGDNGSILHCNGATWAAMVSDTSIDLKSVCGTTSTDVYAAGTNRHPVCPVAAASPCPSLAGYVRHYDGDAWTTKHGIDNCDLTGVWAGSASNVIAVGGGCITRYDGQGWTGVPLPDGISPVSLNAVWGRSPSDVYAVGSGGNLHWDGGAWSAWSAGKDLYGVWSSPGGEVFAVGDDGTILQSRPPAIQQISATRAAQGDSASIAIAGTNLDTTSVVSFGEGISVEGLVIESASLLTASIEVGQTAGPGPRDIALKTEGGSATLRSAFTVEPAPPVLLAVDFTRARRGERVWFTAIGRYLAEAISLDFGEGITVDDFKVHDHNRITASIFVAPEAALGWRDATVVAPGGSGTLPGAFEVAAAPSRLTPWGWVGAGAAGGAFLAAAAGALLLARRGKHAG